MIPPGMAPRDGTTLEPEERPRIPGLILGFEGPLVCFLRSFCLGQTRFWGTFGSFVRGDWWDGHVPVLGGGWELPWHPCVPGLAPRWLFPGTRECFWPLHTVPGTHTTTLGCSRGRGMGHRWIWGRRATVASPEPPGAGVYPVLGSCLVQSPCTTRARLCHRR